METARKVGLGLALWVAYVVLFVGGTSVLGPSIDPNALTPEERAATGPMLLAMCTIDVALLGAWLPRLGLTGARAWAATAVVLYGVKTLSSQIEAWYFVTASHLPPEMLPHLFVMTLPLALVWPALAVAAIGPRAPETPPALGYGPGALVARIAAAGALLYPALFFGFGYFVAWRQPAVRAYYEGPAEPLPFVEHLAAMVVNDPAVVALEVARGLGWVAIGWPVLRHTRGPWWVGALFYAAMMALLQNDVHLLPNALMPGEVRGWHFVETASSNALFALITGWLLRPTDQPSG